MVRLYNGAQAQHPTEKKVRKLDIVQNQEVNDGEAGGAEERPSRRGGGGEKTEHHSTVINTSVLKGGTLIST